MRRRTAAWVAGAAVAALLGSACTGAGKTERGSSDSRALRVGDPAPNFTLPSAQGTDVSLAGFRGGRPVLLYFSMGPG